MTSHFLSELDVRFSKDEFKGCYVFWEQFEVHIFTECFLGDNGKVEALTAPESPCPREAKGTKS